MTEGRYQLTTTLSLGPLIGGPKISMLQWLFKCRRVKALFTYSYHSMGSLGSHKCPGLSVYSDTRMSEDMGFVLDQ